MNILTIYRLPDEVLPGDYILVTLVLSLNGTPLIKVASHHPPARLSPDPELPDEVLALAQSLEQALSIRCNYRDARLKMATAAEVRGTSMRLHAPQQRKIL